MRFSKPAPYFLISFFAIFFAVILISLSPKSKPTIITPVKNIILPSSTPAPLLSENNFSFHSDVMGIEFKYPVTSKISSLIDQRGYVLTLTSDSGQSDITVTVLNRSVVPEKTIIHTGPIFSINRPSGNLIATTTSAGSDWNLFTSTLKAIPQQSLTNRQKVLNYTSCGSDFKPVSFSLSVSATFHTSSFTGVGYSTYNFYDSQGDYLTLSCGSGFGFISCFGDQKRQTLTTKSGKINFCVSSDNQWNGMFTAPNKIEYNFKASAGNDSFSSDPQAIMSIVESFRLN